MILHFLSDDKFSDYVIGQFSSPEMQSEFVLMSAMEKTIYFKNTKNVRIINPYQKDSMGNLVRSLSNYSAIIMHGLFSSWCEVVLRNVPENVKVGWVFWGGEIYGRKDLKKTFLSKRSKRLLWLHDIKLGKKDEGKDDHYELPKELFQRIDYCLTDIPEEYEFVKRYLQTPRMKHVWYNYYSIEETVGKLIDKQCCGDGVFLGNSCSLECNYFDVIPKLKRIALKDKKVIVPLSYGLPWLRNILLRYGKMCIGKSFCPLTKFMPIDDYNTLMLSCSMMIQPHYRPQAQGNIVTGLWLGMKVFLSEHSMTYQWIKRIGVEVFSIESDLNKNNKSVFDKLSQETIDHNREVLSSMYSKEAYRQKIVQLVELLS